MTRDELKKKRKEIAESNGYKGYVPKNRQMREEQARNPEPVQEKKSTWSNVMGRIGSAVGNTMDYISGGQVQRQFNRNNTVNNNLARNDFQYNGASAIPNRYQNSFTRSMANYGKGNIDLNNRPIVKNEDGSISTVRSMSFYDDKEHKEILIPTVIGNRVVSDQEAIDHYYETGEHLGKFDSPEEADKYAEELHLQQEQRYGVENQKKNTSLRQDVRGMGQIVGQSVKGSGQKIMNYIENATLNNSKRYQEIEKQRGIAQYIKENPNKPIMTASDKYGNRQILSDVSVTPTKDRINKAIDETEGKIQTLTEKQNNPVTRKISELLPSMTQSVVGMGVSAINPALRN